MDIKDLQNVEETIMAPYGASVTQGVIEDGNVNGLKFSKYDAYGVMKRSPSQVSVSS